MFPFHNLLDISKLQLLVAVETLDNGTEFIPLGGSARTDDGGRGRGGGGGARAIHGEKGGEKTDIKALCRGEKADRRREAS